MSSALEHQLHALRSIARQVRSAVTSGSLEQRARYKELQEELNALEQEVEEALPVDELSERSANLLHAFRRFQRRVEPGRHVAA